MCRLTCLELKALLRVVMTNTNSQNDKKYLLHIAYHVLYLCYALALAPAFRQFCQAKRAETWSTFWLVLYPLLAYSIAAVLLLLCSGAVKGLPKRGGVGMNALFFAVGLLALVGGILWEPNLVHSISLVSLMEGECLFGLVCAARRKEK